MKIVGYLIVSIIALGIPLAGNATLRQVPGQFPSISSAAAVAVAGDTILVGPGTYTEVPSGVHLRGGVALISEWGESSTVIVGPGLEMGFDAPNLGCTVQGFRFVSVPEENGPDVYNAGQGTTILNCRFDGTRPLGNNFESGRAITVRNCQITTFNIYLGFSQTGQTYSLIQNLIDARGSDTAIAPYGSNTFVIRSNTVIGPRSLFVGNITPSAHVQVVNNIFYAPPEFTQGFGCFPPGPFDIRYNCFLNVLPEASCSVGPTNLFADPAFCNAANEDYRLQANSPCAGAGEGGASMGAFPVGCGLTGIAESDDPKARERVILRPFTNPLVSGRPFVLDLEQNASVKIRLVDTTGRVVAFLLEDTLGPGTHFVPWNGRLQTGAVAPSGVYYLTVTTPEFRKTYRALVVR